MRVYDKSFKQFLAQDGKLQSTLKSALDVFPLVVLHGQSALSWAKTNLTNVYDLTFALFVFGLATLETALDIGGFTSFAGLFIAKSATG